MYDWFYKHKEKGLCLTFKAMINCGVSEDTISGASRRKSGTWEIIQHPEHGKKMLIVWSKLQDHYKEKVIKVIGDPFEYIAKQPIRDMVENDFRAEEYYRNKLLELNVSGLMEYVNKYTSAASWLNMLVKSKADKEFLRKTIGITNEKLIEQTCQIIKSDKIDLPASPRKLEAKIKLYKNDGYDCLIDWRFGNKLAAKIGKTEDGFDADLEEKQTAFIRRCASMHNNFSPAQIADAVNKVFKLQGWKTVSGSTIYSIIEANKHLTITGSRGKRVYQNEYAKQVKRKRPDFPLQYFSLDGWNVELAYNDEKGKVRRLVLLLVIDTISLNGTLKNYPIGYAIGERETTELIREACQDAIIHIKELFGKPYRPWQVQSDHFGIKANTPFFKAMSHLYTPAAVGNAKAKPIEPYFKDLNKKYCQTQYNWTGHNLNAKKSNQVNTEALDKLKKEFPNEAGVIAQINAIIHQERELKKELYLQAWQNLQESEKVVLSNMDLLAMFGKTTGYTYSVSGKGLTATINGQPTTYESFDAAFWELQHLKWTVQYVEHDLSRVLAVSEDGKHRFELEAKYIVPMDVRSMKPADYEHLKRVKDFNKEREDNIKEQRVVDAEVVKEVLNNTLQLESDDELAIKGMFTYNGQQKNSLQDAKGLKSSKDLLPNSTASKAKKQEQANWETDIIAFHKSKIGDVNKYLDYEPAKPYDPLDQM